MDRGLLEQALTNPGGMWFADAVALAEQLGFEGVRCVGSHRIFRHPAGALLRETFPQPLNLQEGPNGKAKAYQVRQMIRMAQALGILREEE